MTGQNQMSVLLEGTLQPDMLEHDGNLWFWETENRSITTQKTFPNNVQAQQV
jgi:hypothetical protein